MTTRATAVEVEALDAGALSRFWGGALNLPCSPAGSDTAGPEHRPGATGLRPAGAGGVELLFVPSARPKTGKNRLHLDLAGGSDPESRVRALLELGAVHADIGQGDVPWRVLADPEGNEFCVLPGPESPDALAAICQDAADPAAQGRFWTAATGWAITDEGDWGIRLRGPAGRGPALVMGPPVSPRSGRNRLRLVLAAGPGDDPADELARLLDAGATRSAEDQHGWLLADPEGNDFRLRRQQSPASAAP